MVIAGDDPARAKDVGARLIEAHEAERRRIAGELHDDIGQRIAALTMELDALGQALPLPTDEARTRVRALSDLALQLARDIQAKIARARDQLLTFCDHPGEVEATTNNSERALRPSVVQRKVTNGYRAMWAAEAEADVRTTIDTARLKGADPFHTIMAALA